MKVAKLRKALLFTIAMSALGLGCELIVDFDRTRIPVEGADAAAVNEAGADAADAATDTAPPACNNLGHLGAAVEIQAALGPAPDTTGGTITPGTYALTQVTEYNATAGVGPTGKTIRRTAVFAPTTYNFIETTGTSDGGVIETRVVNNGITTAGAGDAGLLGVTVSCPGVGMSSSRYSATATTVEIHFPNASTVQVMTKLP